MTWCYLIISPIAGAKCICHLHDYDSVDVGVGVDVDALMRGLPHEGDRPISPGGRENLGEWQRDVAEWIRIRAEPNHTEPKRVEGKAV